MSDNDIELYLKEIGKYKLLNEQQEIDLALKIAKGDIEARENMIRSNLRLVVSIAKRYATHGLPLLDVISEGNIGLLKAVERFDPHSGRRFSTYASWWIKQAIRRALSAKVKNVRVPTYMTEMVRRWKTISSALSQEYQRAATPEEIAEEMEIDISKVGAIKKAIDANFSSSFTTVSYDNESDNLEELLARSSHNNANSTSSFSEDDEKKLNLVLACLEERDEEIIRYRYGIGKDDTLTLDSIGVNFNPPITRERVRQLEAQALKRMLQILDEEEKRHFNLR